MKNKLILAILTCLALSACAPTIAQRGNLLEDAQISQVVVGVHTRSDALRILGSPTTVSAFDDKTWYYIGQETEKRGILDPKTTAKRVVVVKFDDEDVIQSINDQDAEGMDIPVSRDKTPSYGNDMTIMQQFLGNIGRFNPQTEK